MYPTSRSLRQVAPSPSVQPPSVLTMPLAEAAAATARWLVLTSVLASGCGKPAGESNPELPTANRDTGLSGADQLAVLPAEPGAETTADEWDSQFNAVLAGTSDTILVEVQPVSSSQMARLPELSERLEQLLIDAGDVKDSDLKHVSQLPKLRHLRIRESPITDEGLQYLVSPPLTELQIVNIPQGQITSAGIRALGQLPKLSHLRLGGRQLDDAAVAEIGGLTQLRSLHLIGPSLTSTALEPLLAMPRLSSFYLDDCPLDDAAWARLFAAKPNLHVHVDQQHHDRDPSGHSH